MKSERKFRRTRFLRTTGYYNEADPVWAEREIELAAASGIYAFLVDLSWAEGLM